MLSVVSVGLPAAAPRGHWRDIDVSDGAEGGRGNRARDVRGASLDELLEAELAACVRDTLGNGVRRPEDL